LSSIAGPRAKNQYGVVLAFKQLGNNPQLSSWTLWRPVEPEFAGSLAP